MSDPKRKPADFDDMALVDQALKLLSEHFDTVQIFVTRHEPGELDGTVTIKRGSGNFFARYGQIKEWILKEEEQAKINTRKDNEAE